MAFAERSAGRNERLEVTIADLAASQWGLVTTMQVLEAGGTSAWISRKVGAQMMARVLPRVWRLRGFADCWEQRVSAGALWAGAACALSHRTAAQVWSLRKEQDLPITISEPSGLKPPQPWVSMKRRQLLPRDVTRHRGFPVTTPSRTLLDLGSELSAQEVEDALDTALHRGVTSVARMQWQLQVAGGKGARGSGQLRRLLHERDSVYRPTHSVLEKAFRRLLRKNGFPSPVQQHVIHRGKTGKAFVDFHYPALHLVIEVGRVVATLRPFFAAQLSLSER